MVASAPAKNRTENTTTNGSVIIASTEFTAVTVMLSATSARARWLNTLAVAPPGDTTRTIMPMARSGPIPNATTSPNTMSGNTII
ncbi:hypothetical protein PSU4_43110 [Pseudonocardia sulfidoxydans NBRC 16205]|uniref:Uncharacterized protein n=1 Tax=Pseudonocardia sulfidoxydans NBRC 16205 TaxID=1223511 RepID=A0A511DLU3_9PSEU|nr:hypothetical protein PSU4_43110 [Pseudonocardia sulfidoxydans NBRC 16205]